MFHVSTEDVREMINYFKAPEQMNDPNTKTDYNKMKKLLGDSKQ